MEYMEEGGKEWQKSWGGEIVERRTKHQVCVGEMVSAEIETIWAAGGGQQ